MPVNVGIFRRTGLGCQPDGVRFGAPPIVRYWVSSMRFLEPIALVLLAAAPGVAADAPNLTEQYRATANTLIAAALADTEGYDRLAYLCYRIGNRLSGSPSLERAIARSEERMKAAGLAKVRVIPVKVPHWVRGAESARMLEPEEKPLHMLGLGMSIGTPPGGITAEGGTGADAHAQIGRAH